ncbi:MAG: hypothetical protein FWG84_10440, partial [Bacteroidales bacterium]|nr:hypothetical protein [Bacteroidales bacterium]
NRLNGSDCNPVAEQHQLRNQNQRYNPQILIANPVIHNALRQNRLFFLFSNEYFPVQDLLR